MKNMIANLKSKDYKQLAVDHGEKFLLGGVALFALIAWVGTRWAPYDKSPEELSSAVQRTQVSIEQGNWPAARQQQVPLGNLAERVNEAYATINPLQYAFVTDFTWPPESRGGVVIRQPEYYAVNNLQADFAHVVLLEQGKPVSTKPLAAGNNGPKPRQPVPQPGIFNLPVVAANPAGNQMGLTEVSLGPPENVPRRAIGVRGVYEWRRQLQEIAEKSNLPNTNTNPDLLQIADFELQRQTSNDGGKTWSGWEDVDIREALDVLNKADVWDEEVVANQIVEQHITMPLPGLAFGEWGELATHEDVRNYHLSPEGRRLQQELDQKLLEGDSKIEERKPTNGFESLQVDLRGRRRLLGAPGQGQTMDQFRDKYSQEDLRQVQAAGNVLLFRYFDFTVDSGKTYRYRVRLKIYNPNYGRPPYEVESPDLATRKFEFTDWSLPTDPTSVPEDIEYFVHDIDVGSPGRPVATFDMLQWFAKVGTLVEAQFKVEFGAMIGGEKAVEVTHPPSGESMDGYGTREKEEVPFRTRDVLVDVADVPRRKLANSTFHPDLGTDVNIIEQALVVDRDGELVSLDPVTYMAGRRKAGERLREQNLRLPTRTGEGEDALDREAAQYRKGGSQRVRDRRRGDNPARRQAQGRGPGRGRGGPDGGRARASDSNSDQGYGVSEGGGGND